MAEKVEAKIIAREVVKPSAPTPAHLSCLNLSLLDQTSDDMFVPVLFFFTRTKGTPDFSWTCQHLKSSLSETLSHFYPFAGRIRDPSSVDCCDDGAEFVEAEINCPMSLILGAPDTDALKKLVPVDLDPPNRTGFVLAVQATYFECGGVAISICYSHKISDAAAFSTFIKGWTAAATKSSSPMEQPEMRLFASLVPAVPPKENGISVAEYTNVDKYCSRRLVFSASKLRELQTKASSSAVDKPTRVEAVTGLIWKCAASASLKSVKGTPPPTVSSAAFLAVDMRKRLAPLVPESTMGNLVGAIIATSSSDKIMRTSNMVAAMREAKEDLKKRVSLAAEGSDNVVKSIVTAISFEGMMKEAGGEEIMSKFDLGRRYVFSSWCRLPMYEVDLGFGRPKWVTTILMFKNVVVLMDTQDQNGVEALVTLGELEMEHFQADQELLSFASLN